MPPKRKGKRKANRDDDDKTKETKKLKSSELSDVETSNTKNTPEHKAEDVGNKNEADSVASNTNEVDTVASEVADTVASTSDTDVKTRTPVEAAETWNMKFVSWNVNGIRAWLKKNGPDYIAEEKPDIFGCQETKCDISKIPKEAEAEGYHCYWLSGDKDGYSGTGLFSKKEPMNVTYGIGQKKHDEHGRVITAEYDNFYFVTAYVPNSGRGLPRLKYRTTEWDPAFRNYLKELDAKKPVVACGDLNVARLEIDLANPKTNTKTAGFTKEEREEFDKLLNDGFLDSFRELYPETTGVYSYWSYMMNARAKNTGWRLDYFLISARLRKNLHDSLMRSKVMGSDHCPIVLLMDMNNLDATE